MITAQPQSLTASGDQEVSTFMVNGSGTSPRSRALVSSHDSGRCHPEVPAGLSGQRVSERKLQIGIVGMIRRRGLPCFAIPNGGSRHVAEAKNMRAEGVLAGAADLAILLPDGRTGYLEVKGPNGKLRRTQRAFRDAALASGAPWAVARNIDEATAAVDEWLIESGNPHRVGVALAGTAQASPPLFQDTARASRAPD